MYYSGPLTDAQIEQIITDGINMPSVKVYVARVGNTVGLSISIHMNHRYFSVDEFEKILNVLDKH